MVTFVCHYCDVTLKKKQLERHVFACGRPCKFICIDCSTTFIGDDYIKHTQCMTEQEKYHGQYAKKTKQQQQQQQQTKQQQQTQLQPTAVLAEEELKENKKQDNTPTTQKKNKNQEEAEEEQEEQTNTKWIGWKKTIRKIIKEKENKQMKLRKLRELSCKKYKECFPEEEMKDIEKIFEEKIASNSKLQTINEPYITFAN